MAVLIIGVLMMVHLAIGVPLFLILGLGSLAMVIAVGVYSIDIIGQVPFSAIDNWALLAMPLFILTGDIISGGRIAKALTNMGQAMLGWIHGGLGMSTIAGCFFFAGTSGSNSADTAAIGKIMIPSMVEKGYDRPYAAALAAAGGCLGIIVPPSLIFIIYGVVTSTSVGDLFLAGIFPGLLMAASMCVANYFVCRRFGWGVSTKTPFDGKQVLIKTWGARYGLLAPAIILGGIYSGAFTPTESAAVAVAYCLFAELVITKGITWREIPTLLYRSGAITGMIGPIIAFSILFGEVMSVLRLPDALAGAMLSAEMGVVGTMLMIMLLLLIFGCFMETIASIIILMPILLPICAALNIDPVHFGVFVVCTLTIGFITPPVGINLFAASAVSGVPYIQIARRIWPLFLALVVATICIAFIPWLSLWFR
ncbi:TRAP transporter large permease [Allopusillimonas ginsengisoli]|uniref:TRAP transporter large permease n=1 Tax=Allopusillimonas ginsengisoli TaxID=453575 RepID=UPI00143059F3|nr:TRAP transporter large permease [Allopusillimonas ginsengisoli]